MLNKAYELYKEKYGNNAQMIKAIEELAELQVEISKNLNNQGKVENLIEEIADVEIMTEQLKLMFNAHYEVDKIKIFKINRMIERLKND